MMELRIGQTGGLLPVALFTLANFLAGGAAAQTPIPLAHARIGNNTEGATLITEGPFAQQVGVIDGYDVIAIPVDGNGRASQKMFDLKALQPIGNLSGIVFVPSERAYLLNDNGQPDTLLAADERGHPLPPRPITYLPGIPFVFEAEGMTYLPPGSPFPDRIARIVGVPPDFSWDIQIMTRSGVVEREIALPSPLNTDAMYLPGLAYDRFSNAFLISGLLLAHSAGPAQFWKVSPNGALISGPTIVPGATLSLEGLVELQDGRVFAADYAAGKLFAFRHDLTRSPFDDRSFPIGVGVSRPAFGVYDPHTGRYALSGVTGPGVFLQEGAAEISPLLASSSRLFGFDGAFEPRLGLAFVPEDDAFALGRFFSSPLGIDIFRRNGTLLQRIDFSTVPGLPQGVPARLAYIPRTRQFAVWMFQFTNQVFLVSRNGTYDGSFTVAAAPSSLQYASQSGQDTLLVWAPPNLFAYDLSGKLLVTQQLPSAGLVHPDGFIAGPGDGYALFDPNSSEFAVFSARR